MNFTSEFPGYLSIHGIYGSLCLIGQHSATMALRAWRNVILEKCVGWTIWTWWAGSRARYPKQFGPWISRLMDGKQPSGSETRRNHQESSAELPWQVNVHFMKSKLHICLGKHNGIPIYIHIYMCIFYSCYLDIYLYKCVCVCVCICTYIVCICVYIYGIYIY